MLIKELHLDQIRTDFGTQMRIETSDVTVNEYARLLEDGVTFKYPLIVFEVDGEYILVDGFHRFFACKKAERATIPCEIRQGTLDDAHEFACCANQAHGLQRNDNDKRKAVIKFFGIPGRDALTNSEVSKRLNVSVPFVKKVRDELGVKASPAAHHGQGSKKRQAEGLNDSIPTVKSNTSEGTGLNGFISSATKKEGKTITIDLPVDKPHDFVMTLLEHVEPKLLKSCRDYLNDVLQ
jgi:hypothetical protein